MNTVNSNVRHRRSQAAFTLVEMLVVIAIMSVLMTAGAIGLGNMGGKGVTSGVASAESIFDEARSMAVGKNVRACVLIAKDLTNNGADNLRRIVVAYEDIDLATGAPVAPDSDTPNWVLSSRGILLPEQTFFSATYSFSDQAAGSGAINTVTAANLKSAPGGASVKAAYAGTYYIYEFNAEGICKTPGASFVLGSGTRGITGAALTGRPRVTSAGKRDFGGFVVWRNGRTSVFRSPEQISANIKSLKAGGEF